MSYLVPSLHVLLDIQPHYIKEKYACHFLSMNRLVYNLVLGILYNIKCYVQTIHYTCTNNSALGSCGYYCSALQTIIMYNIQYTHLQHVQNTHLQYTHVYTVHIIFKKVMHT